MTYSVEGVENGVRLNQGSLHVGLTLPLGKFIDVIPNIACNLLAKCLVIDSIAGGVVAAEIRKSATILGLREEVLFDLLGDPRLPWRGS